MASSRSIILLPILLACAPDVTESPGADEVGESAESSEDAPTSDGEISESAESMDSASTSESESSESDTASTTDDTTATTETTEGPSDCFDNADCGDVGNCLEGDCVEVSSCKQLADLDTNDTLGDGVYQLDPDAGGPLPAYAAYCDMTSHGGGWTLVLKSDGNLDTFRYDAAHWTSTDPFQPEFPDLDHHEAKLASYASVPVSELLIGIETPVGVDPNPLVLTLVAVPVAGSSLHALVSPGVLIPTALGRDGWKSLMPGSSLQLNCNLEGLNVMPSIDLTNSHVRIGIVTNEQNDCNSPNSRLGIGGGGNKCNALPNPTGNFAGCMADNGDVNLIGFGVVLVR